MSFAALTNITTAVVLNYFFYLPYWVNHLYLTYQKAESQCGTAGKKS